MKGDVKRGEDEEQKQKNTKENIQNIQAAAVMICAQKAKVKPFFKQLSFFPPTFACLNKYKHLCTERFQAYITAENYMSPNCTSFTGNNRSERSAVTKTTPPTCVCVGGSLADVASPFGWMWLLSRKHTHIKTKQKHGWNQHQTLPKTDTMIWERA